MVDTPTAQTEQPVAKEIALQVQFDVRISEKKQISLTSYIVRDCPDNDMNWLLDKMGRAAQRLQWVNELEELERSIAHLTKQYGKLMEDRRVKDEEFRSQWDSSGRRGNYRPSGNEAKYLQDNAGMQERHRQEIDTMETQRDRILAKLNGGSHEGS